MQVIGYMKAIDGTAIIDYDAEPGKDYVGRMAIEEFEKFQKTRTDDISVVMVDDEGGLYFGRPKIPTESELWLSLPKETRMSKEFLYANLRYKFFDDNPEAGLDLQRPLIEIQGEKLTCDEALKKMTYYLGDNEEKYEIYKTKRKNAKEYIRKYSLFFQKKV